MLDDLDIFLSYVRENERSAKSIYKTLTDAEFKVWMDTKCLLPGHDWHHEIMKALRHARIVIICLSIKSVAKRGVLQKEIRTALDIRREKLDSDIYLIPVRLNRCVVPDSLADLQYVDWFSTDGPTRLLTAIRVALTHLSEKAPVIDPGGLNERSVDILITSPADDEEVDGRVLVTGYVRNQNARVHVIVRSLEGSAFWVQPQVSIRENGIWKVLVYVGRQSLIDAGKYFEIKAVVNPQVTLQEGMILDQWPIAEHVSQVVGVTRRVHEHRRNAGGRNVVAGSVNGGIIITGDGNKVTVDDKLVRKTKKRDQTKE